MACTVSAPCGGVLYPDVAFNRQAENEGVRVRRFACLNGHSFMIGPPPARRGHVTLRPDAKTCLHCGLPILDRPNATVHRACSKNPAALRT